MIGPFIKSMNNLTHQVLQVLKEVLMQATHVFLIANAIHHVLHNLKTATMKPVPQNTEILMQK
jgi:hypothetical protein